MPSAIERFWSKTKVSGDCLEWTGYRSPSGYGQFDVARRPWRAHRWIYWMVLGAKPVLIQHSCDNRACVKIQHLEAGTPATNRRDADNKGRSARGERNGNAKLTREMVAEIRAAHSSGEAIRSLSRRFGVARFAIFQIVKRQTWKD